MTAASANCRFLSITIQFSSNQAALCWHPQSLQHYQHQQHLTNSITNAGPPIPNIAADLRPVFSIPNQHQMAAWQLRLHRNQHHFFKLFNPIHLTPITGLSDLAGQQLQQQGNLAAAAAAIANYFD